jgi:hypothetical protein
MIKTISRILVGVSLLSIPSLSNCQKLPVLQLEDAYKKQEPINSNEFIGSVKYIPLETSQNCLIGASPNINATEKYFIITDNQNHCYLFDRFTGKFIREIGHYGKDPAGYRSNRGFFNEMTATIFFTGWKGDLLKYSLEGKYLGSILIPNFNDGLTDSYVPDRFEYLDNNLIVCNIINTNGLLKTLLLIFDVNGKEIKTIPNRKPLIEHTLSISVGDVKYFHFKNKLYFNEYCNDTIFNVSLKSAEPYLIMDRGKLIPTRENRSKVNDIIQTRAYFESEKFFLITLWIRGSNDNLAFYNKSTSKLKVCNFETGFKNNTDGFVPFIPKGIYNDELLGIIQQQDISLWLEKNKALKDKLPKELKDLTLKDPADNPTIAIAKLK